MADYDFERAFARVEDELLRSMIRNMKKHSEWEDAEGFNWSMWQAEQLKALDKYKQTNKKKFSKQFSQINSRIKEAIEEARKDGNMAQEIEILKALRKGYKTPKSRSGSVKTQAAFFRLNDRKMDALISATIKDVKRAETAVLRMANDKYRKIIFDAQVYANSGAGTYEKAVDMATHDFLAAGLNCVEYANGTRHTLKNYAMMAIRTASKRAYLQGEGEKRQEWGISTVIVNKRGNPCPKCLPFCGEVLVDDVWSGGKKGDGPYPLLSSAIAAGLYHPNCKDSHTTYFPGISTPPDGKFTTAEVVKIERKYSKEQRENHIAKQVEKYDRLAEFSLDEDNRERYKVKRDAYKVNPNKQKPDSRVELLTDEEVGAINRYISGESYQLNAKLREQVELTPEEENWKKILDNAIMKLPHYEGTVYRSISSTMVTDLDFFNLEHAPGNIVNYNAYTSAGVTVYDESFDIQYIIQSRRASDLRKYNTSEQEILFKPGSKFYVVRREGNTIWMDEM